MKDGPKTGTKTSEFWITVGLQVVALILETVGVLQESGIIAGGSAGMVLTIGGLVLQVASALGYKATRASVKKAHAQAVAAANKERAEVRVATLGALDGLQLDKKAELLARVLDASDPFGGIDE